MTWPALLRVLCLRCGQWWGLAGAKYRGPPQAGLLRLPRLSLCSKCSMDPMGRGLARLHSLVGSDVDVYLGTGFAADP